MNSAREKIPVEYTDLARILGVPEMLPPERFRELVYLGFRRLGVSPIFVDFDDLKLRIGYGAAHHGGQGTYDGNGTIHLGVYRLLNNSVASRVATGDDGRQKSDMYFNLIFRSVFLENDIINKHLGGDDTPEDFKRDAEYVYGKVSLDDFNLRELESILAHEVDHFARPKNRRLRMHYSRAFRETVGDVIGGMVNADSRDQSEIIRTASKYGYESAKEYYRPKPKTPPTIPEDVDMSPETRQHLNEQLRKNWESSEEPEFPRHLRRYCNRVARHMSNILMLGDEETKVAGLRASSLRQLEDVAKNLYNNQ